MTTGWIFDHIKEFFFKCDNVLWLCIFESLKRQYSNINEINYVRSGIGFKIKRKRRKYAGGAIEETSMAMSWSLLKLVECFVYAWVSLKFSTIKSVVVFLKVSVMSQKFSSFEKKMRVVSTQSRKSLPGHTPCLIKNNLLLLQSNIYAL